MNSIGEIKDKTILFLQGPMGGFFKRLDHQFSQEGALTYKIGFNAGDSFFSAKDNYIPYRGTKKNWGNYVHNFLLENSIDKIFLFGDCRFYQRVAIEKSKKLNIEIFVFEEGYIRPDFITLERYGVNDFSHVPRDRKFYDLLDISQFKEKKIHNANINYYRIGWSAAIYYILASLFWFRYPHYEHHRKLNFVTEAFYAVRNAVRKYKYKFTERKLLAKILDQYRNNYYFVPLQTYDDFQVKEHSSFFSMESFIEIVLRSFAKFAPAETQLVIKHHPMDRGRKDYTEWIERLSAELEIENRVISMHDLHLPSCLKNTIGTITINSTVGTSSLYHQAPTLVLGNAIYDIEGLTCKNMSLDKFWKEYEVPEEELFNKFRGYLIENTQLNGSFYGRFPDELRKLPKEKP